MMALTLKEGAMCRGGSGRYRGGIPFEDSDQLTRTCEVRWLLKAQPFGSVVVPA